MKEFQNDQEIITAICGGPKEANAAISWILKHSSWRNSVGILIRKFQMDFELREEVFYECLSALVINIQKDSFKTKSSLKTYFEGICKNNLKTRLTKKTKNASLFITMETNSMIENEEVNENTILENDRQSEIQGILRKLIKSLGDKCQKVLQYQMLDYSMREIGDLLNMERQSVKNRSFDCRKKLRVMAIDNPTLIAQIKSLI